MKAISDELCCLSTGASKKCYYFISQANWLALMLFQRAVWFCKVHRETATIFRRIARHRLHCSRADLEKLTNVYALRTGFSVAAASFPVVSFWLAKVQQFTPTAALGIGFVGSSFMHVFMTLLAYARVCPLFIFSFQSPHVKCRIRENLSRRLYIYGGKSVLLFQFYTVDCHS